MKVFRSAGAEKKSKNFKGKIEGFVVDSMPGPMRSLSKQKIKCEVEN